MKTPKNIERDKYAGLCLTRWMREQGYSDAALAKLIQRSVPTVATWRHGTRPMNREREWLAQHLGWHWDSPPGASNEPTPIPERALEPDSAEGVLLARSILSNALSEGRLLDPKNAQDRFALGLCGVLLDTEINRRASENRTIRTIVEVRALCLDHQDPAVLVEFLRKHGTYPSEILDMVERSLPQTTTRRAVPAEA